MLTGTLKKDGQKTPKYIQTTELILEPFYQKYVMAERELPATMQGLHQDLKGNPGFASFMAGQVTADARWAGVWDSPPKDRMTWAPMGPGSYKGLNFLYRPDGHANKFPTSEFPDYFAMFLAEVQQDEILGRIGSRLGMEAHDWQNVLCETSKYISLKEFGKNPKRRYRNKSPLQQV